MIQVLCICHSELHFVVSSLRNRSRIVCPSNTRHQDTDHGHEGNYWNNPSLPMCMKTLCTTNTYWRNWITHSNEIRVLSVTTWHSLTPLSSQILYELFRTSGLPSHVIPSFPTPSIAYPSCDQLLVMVASQPSLLQVLIQPILQYEPVGERPRLRAELDTNSDGGTTMEVDVSLRLLVLQQWLRRDPRISTV